MALLSFLHKSQLSRRPSDYFRTTDDTINVVFQTLKIKLLSLLLNCYYFIDYKVAISAALPLEVPVPPVVFSFKL